MNVVVIAPHPDDESIGCGGTIRLHYNRGDRVHVIFLTSGELGLKSLPTAEARLIREGEAEKACRVLGVSEFSFLRYPDLHLNEHVHECASDLEQILKQELPNLIYVPHEQESHPDHQAALPITQLALSHANASEPTILTYEVWTPLPDYYHVEDITPVMNAKLRAIRSHKSQVQELAFDRAVRGLNEYRGVTAGACRYAEIFQHAELLGDDIKKQVAS